MNINITSRNFEITSAIKSYTEKKINKLEKFLSPVTETTIILSVEKHRHKVEVLINVNGHHIQAEAITSEMYSAVDEVMEKLDRQIKKYKEKVGSKRKEGSKVASEAEEGDTVIPHDEEKESIKIIKKEQLKVKPMSPEEAAMQLDLLERDFFVFKNDKSTDINVIYKRKDGDLGLIEPAK
ncbi:MAG: ribosome-associated translation inhibitor RaiA [Candidatus Magnetoovum sp. WYHC-5]|nr:ribosome-associated translation inhibitor RaiA [Candidatus Magnetoovum sp. WYHC-5]